LVAILILMGIGGWRELRCGICLHDDAYISFRYARNMTRGAGLVYNVGERVEGYTNFLWVILLSAISGPEDDLTQVARFAGLAASLAVLLVLYAAGNELGLGLPWNLVAPALLVTHRGYLAESVMGLETALYTLLCLLGGWWAVGPRSSPRRQMLCGLLFALAAMTRPEGALVAVLFLAWPVLRKRRGAWGAIAAFLVPLLCFHLWRFSYYGYPFPNTFYAKVGWTADQVVRGWRYLADFLRGTGPAWLVAVAASPFLGWRHRAWVLPAFVTVGFYSAYLVAIGGDFNLTYRFYMVLLPWMGLLAAASMRGLGQAARGPLGVTARAISYVWMAMVCLNLAGSFEKAWEYAAERRNNLPSQRSMGEHLREIAAPGDVLAIHAAGTAAYYADVKTVDMYGLTDVHIAHLGDASMGKATPGHEKGDAAYVLSRRPRFLVLATHFDPQRPVPWRVFRLKRASRVDRDLMSHPDFRAHYRRADTEVEGGFFTYFVRH
jgi:hypothetical protein